MHCPSCLNADSRCERQSATAFVSPLPPGENEATRKENIDG